MTLITGESDFGEVPLVVGELKRQLCMLSHSKERKEREGVCFVLERMEIDYFSFEGISWYDFTWCCYLF